MTLLVENPNGALLGTHVNIRGVQGIDRVLVPVANYVYDSGSGTWIYYDPGAAVVVIVGILTTIADGISDLGDKLDVGNAELVKINTEGVVDKMLSVISPPALFTTGVLERIPRIGLRQGIEVEHDLGVLAAFGYRKMVGIDEGSYVSPGAGGTLVTFSGVNLNGRINFIYNVTDSTWHRVSGAVTDPVGATPGNFNLTPAVISATPILIIPFLSIPHGLDLLADGWRNNQLNPAQNHSQFDQGIVVSITGGQPDTPATQPTFAITSFNRVSIHVIWTCGSTATWQIDLLIRGYAGATAVNINSLFAVGGTALGAPAGSGNLFATSIHPIKGYELLVARTGVNGAVNANHSMTGTVNQHYA